ncbi:MAG: NmrA family NAD(P)-binding protein [Bryobacteraceae bacterium]|nr:NmrA family NAD(P)-binding protein [Bryobacteraceae bacterium]
MILVTGGSGRLARRVLELLLEQGAGPLMTTTRTPERLEDLQGRGVTVRNADFTQEHAALVRAFRGAQKMLLVSTNTLEAWGKRFEQHERAVRAAVEAGVGHIVYTSITFPYPVSPVPLARDHFQTENLLRECGVEYTLLRNNIYAESLLFLLPDAVRTGRLRAAAGGGKAAFVTREDCARAAAGALLRGETRCSYEVSGPEALSFADLARIAGELSGRTVVYEPVEPAVRLAELKAAGTDPMLAELQTGFERAIAEGLLDLTTRDVERLWGTPAAPVSQFLRDHAAEWAQV